MPGISGFIVPQVTDCHRRRIAEMVGCMKHEPFYNSGTSVEDTLGTLAGWVCHQGSYADCMPIWNACQDICLLFSGEHYGDSGDDASSLVRLYEKHRSRFFQLLNGTFSGLILDKRENKVVLFNDRFGLGRVYYHESKEGFYFASEAKALMRVWPHLREMDMRGLGELMVCGCTLQDRTLFPGISLLPAGSAWTFSPGQPVRKESYFDRASWETHASPLPEEEYYDALKSTFNRILPRYFRGRQPVSLSLTGGLDSRMIIAAMTAWSKKLPCFTFAGMYRDSEDVRVGREIARLCGQSYSTITVDDRFVAQFPDLVKKCVYITDGTMDASGSVGLYVNRQSRDIAPVRMTGNYGSEILRDNSFRPGHVSMSPFSEQLRTSMRGAISTFQAESGNSHRLSFIAFKQVPWFHYARFAEETSQLTIRAPYLDNDLVPLAYRAPAGVMLNKQLSYRYTTDTLPVLAGAPTDRGLLNRSKLVPLKLFELSKELRPKAEYYFDYGMPQWLAKVDSVLSPMHLERLFLGNQKYYHFRLWYRHALSSFVQDVLLDPATLSRPYFDREFVQKMVRAHVTGNGNYTLEIHKLLTIEMIHRHLLRIE